MSTPDGAGPQSAASRRSKGGDVPLEAFAECLAPGMRLIGIDLGTTTIGLALSDVTRIVGSALLTIERTKFRADTQRLLAIAREHGVGGLVVGLPVNMNGTEGPRAQATRAFVRNLAPLTDLPILFWDERLTTEAAERMLIAADTSRRRRGEVIDKLAATLILQGSLDRLRRLAPVEDE